MSVPGEVPRPNETGEQVPSFYGFEQPGHLPPNLSDRSVDMVQNELIARSIVMRRGLRMAQVLTHGGFIFSLGALGVQVAEGRGDDVPNPPVIGPINEWLAHLPMDWKGGCLAIGAFAATNVASRVVTFGQIGKQLEKSHHYVEKNGEVDLIADGRALRDHRYRHTVGRWIATAAGCTLAYKAGEHTNAAVAMSGELVGITGSVIGGVRYTKAQEKRYPWLRPGVLRKRK